MIGTNSVAILGIPIHHVSFDDAVSLVAEFVAEHQDSGRTHQVVTVNTDFVVRAAGDADVQSILQTADLAFADGMPVVWGSKVLGAPLPERVAGADWVPAVVASAATSGHRVMFFGGAGDSATQAAAALRLAHPTLEIEAATGMVDSDGTANSADIGQISAFAPDILFVGLGHPKQEHFIVRYGSTLGVPVAAGVGATFQFMTGDDQRAPMWMQRSGLEWMHRMVRDPGRLVKRYATDAVVFFPRLLVQRWRTRGRGHGLSVDLSADSPTLALDGVDRLSRGDLATLTSGITAARRQSTTLQLRNASGRVRRQITSLRISPLVSYESSDRS